MGIDGSTQRPDVRFATTSDGLRIAYSSCGDGPPLVFVRGFNSHVEVWWDDYRVRRYFEALGALFTTVWFDARGNGRSDAATSIDLDMLVEDVRAVTDALGAGRVTLFGQGFGSPVAIAYAARFPERVERLLLYCAHATGLDAITDLFIETMRQTPAIGRTILAHGTYPDSDALPRRLIKPVEAHPDTAAAFLRLTQSVDVTAELSDVRAQTLVMQPERSPVVRMRDGVAVADGIHGSRLVMIASGAYNAWTEEIADLTLHAISESVGRAIPSMPKPRPMTVLVTDIVASTEAAHRLGDERARELLHTHDLVVRTMLHDHTGAEVKHTGDGIMSTFESPVDALACAIAIQRGLRDARSHDPEVPDIRIGLALGDVVEERGDLFGTTVVLAVRLNARAKPGQILVSDTVRSAVVSDELFGSRRSLALKGFPERIAAHDVRWAD